MGESPPQEPQSAFRADPRTDAPPRLLGRSSVLDELTAPDAPPVTLLQGAGRSAVLDELHASYAGTGARILRLRAGEHDRLLPFGALYRLLCDVERWKPEPGTTGARGSVLGLVAKLSATAVPTPGSAHTPDSAGRLAWGVFTAVRPHLPVVVLIDDAQWLDDDTAAVLEPLVRRMAGQRFSVVLAARPSPLRTAGFPALAPLLAAGLARVLTLRPLTTIQSRRLIAETLRARPDTALVEELHRTSRGLPPVLVNAIARHKEAGELRVVDRHAYLLPTGRRLPVNDQHPLLAPVRETGAHTWAVARAMSLFAAFGAQAPDLVAEAVDSTAEEARDALDVLVRHRVLLRAGSGWRFRVPMVRHLVECGLGPYERRHLSALAVEAIWNLRAHTEDPLYLLERLVDAGRLVDPQRAGKELLEAGMERLFEGRYNVAGWLKAAADKVDDPVAKATALLAHAAVCVARGRMGEAAYSSSGLLDACARDVPEQLRQQAVLVHLTATAGLADRVELQRIVDTPEPVPGGRTQQLVAKAFALGWLDRWSEGLELLESSRDLWVGGPPVLEDHANAYRTGVAVLRGATAELNEFVAEPERWRSTNLTGQSLGTVRHQVNLLLALGELDPALELLNRNKLEPEHLDYTDQFAIHFLRGDWMRAISTARRSIAASVPRTRPFGWAMLYAGAAWIHVSGGMLNRARYLIDEGRDGPLPHMFALPEAQVLRVLGEHERADDRLDGGLRAAAERGFGYGTERFLAGLALSAHSRDDPQLAERYFAQLEEVVERLDTGRGRLHLLVARAQLRGDRDAAEEAVRLVRERGQPYEMTVVFTHIGCGGHRTGELLPEAYHLAGELPALLLRSQLRRMMREHQVPVPSRATTTSENERLLAVLVTEGLTNRQLATVFGATEKSVEGRLTRMFARIGYRSRVELATAMLTGDYPG